MRLHAYRFLAFSIAVFIASPCLSQDSIRKVNWTYERTSNRKEIEIRKNGQHVLICRFDTEMDRVLLSFDEEALIVSENSYIKTIDLRKCDHENPTIYFTPEDDGMLVDFNSKNSMYISLIFVATRPLSYVAHIGRTGRKRNLVNLPGSYNERKTISKMQQEGFNYSDEFVTHPKISLNGRYVDPAGDMDCSAQSHPGVWDIEKNKKVIFPQSATSVSDCAALFQK